MVRPARFELATPWFEAKYSNPLSYGRVLLWLVHPARFELATFGTGNQRSIQLSYGCVAKLL